MFKVIAQLAVRFRWLIIIIWVVAVPLVVGHLPSLSSVSNSDNSGFLPSNSPSNHASQLAVPFEGKNTSSTAIIVAARENGPLTAADGAAITQAEQRVSHIKGVALVRDEGTSQDGQARQALVAISGASFGTGAITMVDKIRSTLVAHAPTGLSLHLTGSLAEAVDSQNSSNKGQDNTEKYSFIFIILLLLAVYRSALAPLITLLPAGLSLVLAGPLIAEASKAGLQVSPITQILLIVLILGAGTDYGLFLVFRVREELRRGLEPRAAIVEALSRVGVTITFSAATVMAALLSLLLASFGLYRGLGPALAIGLAVMLLAALTLLPALLAVFGRVAFWPSRVKGGERTVGFWGKVADRVIRKPVYPLVIGVLIFGGLAIGIVGYRVAGFTSSQAPSGSDSAQGTAILTQHFPSASNDPEGLFLRFGTSVWGNLEAVSQAQTQLTASPLFQSIGGPLNPAGVTLTASELSQLHSELGPAALLPPVAPLTTQISPSLYQAYRSTAQFISADGKTVQFYAILRAGASGSDAATNAVPAVRVALARAAATAGAKDNGVYGLDSVTYDISHTATSDLRKIIPVVLLIIAVLLALLLRSFVAPWYLIATVGLSYLAALGFAMIVFVHLKGESGLNFILPFLMFIFSMALGEDYNILVMSRIREEAHLEPSLPEAVKRAIGVTGTTVTSAGLILAGTFTVLGFSGGNDQVQQIGFGIAFGVLLDTLFVRTLLVPSIVVLLGRWNWWPSRLWNR